MELSWLSGSKWSVLPLLLGTRWARLVLRNENRLQIASSSSGLRMYKEDTREQQLK